MPMSGLEFVLVIVLFLAVFWPSRKGKSGLSRVRGWFAPRKQSFAPRIKVDAPLRPAPPAAPAAPVKPAPGPAVRIGRARRPYVKAKAGAAGRA